MSAPKITASQWLAAAQFRRTVYALKDSSLVPDSRLEDIVKQALSAAPSSYNTQPGRVTLVLGENHKKLWDVVIKHAEPVLKGVSPDIWETLGPRFESFKSSYGSVLFWDRGQTIEQAKETHKNAAHMFDVFADHSSGMVQILVWTALELEGFGANLQHSGAIPTVEAAIRNFVGVPEDYKLKANLNFGEEAQPHPAAPAKLPFSETVKII